MKKIQEIYPYLLLLSYLILIHIKPTGIADSIVIAALCGLCGYKMFLDRTHVPDFKKECMDEIEKTNKELQKQVAILSEKVSEVQANAGQAAMVASRKGISNETIRF